MQSSKSQHGQATTEFIVAMFLFVPLMLAVIFSGKYADIKHQAIQASRYAAMGRALDPHHQRSDTALGYETVARYFRDGGSYQVAASDSLSAPTGDQNPNWSELNGNQLVAKYSDVGIDFKSNVVGKQAMDAAASLYLSDLSTGYGVEADVKVKVADVAQFSQYPILANLNLTIRAATVMGGDPWNAGGADDVANHIKFTAVPTKAASPISNFPGIKTLFEWLAGAPAPQFGCVPSDVVPDYIAPNASYDPSSVCH